MKSGNAGGAKGHRFEITILKTDDWDKIYEGAVAIFDKLLLWLVQEIPEELSIVEFECYKTDCTISDWVVCKPRHQVAVYDKGVIRHNTFEIETEATA